MNGPPAGELPGISLTLKNRTALKAHEHPARRIFVPTYRESLKGKMVTEDRWDLGLSQRTLMMHGWMQY